MATETERAALTRQRALQAARMTDAAERSQYIAETGNIDKDYDNLLRKTQIMENVLNRREVYKTLNMPPSPPQHGLFGTLGTE